MQNEFVKLRTISGCASFRKASVIDFIFVKRNDPATRNPVYSVDIELQTSSSTSVQRGFSIPSEKDFDEFVAQMNS